MSNPDERLGTSAVTSCGPSFLTGTTSLSGATPAILPRYPRAFRTIDAFGVNCRCRNIFAAIDLAIACAKVGASGVEMFRDVVRITANVRA
jgi:hypothetical protein